MLEDMRKYMAFVTIYENNFRVLHWKLSGCDFQTAHPRYGDYYDHMGDMLDEVAEQIISMGGNPVNAKEALGMLEASTDRAIIIDSAEDYSACAADTAASIMFNTLYDLAVTMCKTDDIPVDVQDMFIQHSKYYRIENKFKIARTMIITKSDNTPASVATSTVTDVSAPNSDDEEESDEEHEEEEDHDHDDEIDFD